MNDSFCDRFQGNDQPTLKDERTAEPGPPGSQQRGALETQRRACRPLQVGGRTDTQDTLRTWPSASNRKAMGHKGSTKLYGAGPHGAHRCRAATSKVIFSGVLPQSHRSPESQQPETHQGKVRTIPTGQITGQNTSICPHLFGTRTVLSRP